MMNLKRFRDRLLPSNAFDQPDVPDYPETNLADLAALAIIMLDGSCSNPRDNGFSQYDFEGHCLGYKVIAAKTSDGVWIIDSMELYDC